MAAAEKRSPGDISRSSRVLKRKNRDWFDENNVEIQDLLQKLQKCMWWIALAEQTQLYADTGNTCAFYEALRAVYGPMQQVQAPLRSSHGNSLLTDKESILHRWTEHYENLFGDKRQVQEEAIRKIPQQAVKTELDIPPIQQGVKAAIANLKRYKAPGVDGVPEEVYKNGSDTLLCKTD